MEPRRPPRRNLLAVDGRLAGAIIVPYYRETNPGSFSIGKRLVEETLAER